MDSYKLFVDKTNTFQCKLELEGASLNNASVRVILEGHNRNYLYEGTVTKYGDCEVSLDKLNDIFKAGDSGTMRLEVIADDAYFMPWESDYEIDASKKLRVEVITPREEVRKPTIKVEVKQEKKITEQEEFGKLVNFVAGKIKNTKVPAEKLKSNKKLNQAIHEMASKCIHKHNVDKVLNEALKQ